MLPSVSPVELTLSLCCLIIFLGLLCFEFLTPEPLHPISDASDIMSRGFQMQTVSGLWCFPLKKKKKEKKKIVLLKDQCATFFPAVFKNACGTRLLSWFSSREEKLTQPRSD